MLALDTIEVFLMRMDLITICLFTIGCGQVNATNKYHAKEAEMYLVEFEQDYGISTGQTEVTMSDKGFEKNVIGYCMSDDINPTGNIVLNSVTWPNLTDTEKHNLVYHELGHCILLRDHNDALYPDGCYRSIMNTYLISDFCYFLHKDELINELRYR